MLTCQKRFLKCAAQAGLICAAEKAAQFLHVDFFYSWGAKTWEYYQYASREVRIAELEEITPCTQQQIQAEVAGIVAENAAGATAEVQAQVVDLVCQIPASIRCGLRRLDDTSGNTVPKTLKLDSADDLIKLMPHKLSRFKPGDRIPGIPWQLVEKIGDGGFGEVWKACDPDYPGLAPVAIKFCLDGVAATNLEHEARVISRLMQQAKDHPGIVALKVVYKSDPPCLVYEFIDGCELSKQIEEWGPARDAASFRRAAKVVQQLAKIVGFAHRLPEPIVHRDLKPANVLVTPLAGKLQFKIADFGIGGLAATRANQQAAQASKVETRLSQQRGAYTPVYSSPQQRKGGPADVRDDVHALGVIWYQLLVGDPSASLQYGDSWKTKLKRQGMPETWIGLLVRCVDHDPDVRPDDAAVLAEQLSALLKEDRAPPVEARTERVALSTRSSSSVHRDAIPQFTRWDETPGEIAGASQTIRIRLKRVGQLSDEEWALLRPLRFWLNRRGTLTHTFGYIRSELPRTYLEPLDRWIAAAKGRGEGATIRQASVGEVVRINVAAQSIEFEDESRGQQLGGVSHGVRNDIAITNSIGMQLNLVPRGAFWMGSEAGKPSDNHVAINHDFYLGIHPVTQGQWQAIMGNNPSIYSRSGMGRDFVENIEDAELQQFPVEQVSWNDAQEFLQRLNMKERLPEGTYRLPSETEWEYACRGATQSRAECAFDFYFGTPTNSLTPALANFGKNMDRTTRVGSYPANPLGLFDLHGNVCEWCADWFNDNQDYRVLRGGCFFDNSGDCRSAERCPGSPEDDSYFAGVRICRTA